MLLAAFPTCSSVSWTFPSERNSTLKNIFWFKLQNAKESPDVSITLFFKINLNHGNMIFSYENVGVVLTVVPIGTTFHFYNVTF